MKFRYFSFIAAASVLAMASCTDDGPNEGNNPENPEGPSAGVQSLGNVPVNVYTDLDKFGGSIYNYNPFVGGSRAGESLPTFTTTTFDEECGEYASPTGLEEIVPGTYGSKKDGVIKQSGTYKFSNADYATIYVEAQGVEIEVSGNGTKFYIAPTASVKFTNKLDADKSVIAWGNVEIAEISSRTVVIIKGDFSGSAASLKMDQNATLKVGGNLILNELICEAANISSGTFTFNGNLSLTNDIKLSVAEFIKVKGNFEVYTQGNIFTKCLDVTGDLTNGNTGNIIIGSSVSAANLYMPANGTLTLEDEAAAKITGVIDLTKNGDASRSKIVAVDDNTPNLIGASELKAYLHKGGKEFSISEYFDGNILLSDKMTLTNTGGGDRTTIKYDAKEDVDGYFLTMQEGVNFGDVDFKGSADGCFTASTNKPKPVPPVIPDVITEIRDHKHPISATCVALGPDNDFYLSWHKRGAGQVDTEHAIWGCIERLVYDPSENVVKLLSFMETDNAGSITQHPVTYEKVDGAYDFNHVIYHNGKLYATGEHPKKGGFIAEINLPMGDWENSLDIMTARSLLGTKADEGKGHGISGNCVVVTPEGKFLIADAGGYQEATRNIFDRQQRIDEKGKPVTSGGGIPVYDWVESLSIDKDGAKFKLTDGSAKHIAINGNMVATIEYTKRHQNEYNENDAKTTLPALISVYDQYSNWLGTPAWTAEVEEFAPIYGKNVIAVDNDGTVYSCQGRNGVGKYTSGGETGRFDVTKWAETYTDANGATFNGGDKKGFAAAAANGLCIAGDYLFVAYGGAGVYVLDKNTMNVLSWYDTGGSANYVQVRNGIAYIAYGISGAQVVNFKLDEIKK